jgi:membrane-bound lytic murein transglycosylase D
MSIHFRCLAITLLVAALLTVAGCGSSEKSRAAVSPPMRATAPTLAAAVPPSPPPQIEEKVVPKSDPVDDILSRVEREYQNGQANYAAGHLEAAKEAFDRAFNLLLQSPIEVGSNERLHREFDKIVEGVHGLEIVALKEGDGFTEQHAEPAPIDEANDITFPVDPRLKAKAEAEIKQTHSDLPLVLNDEVAGYINYFSTRGHGTLERALTRAGRYREMILRVLQEEGVPQDLIYLAQAESGFQPLALSRAGARGMWQFIAGRASGYGLQRNWWIDERQDPEKATRAAAKHLRDLHNQFGDWYLAMAAYNSGPGTVQAAVERTGYADFWELYRRRVLPAETKNYVPIILAVTIMAKNPSQYGLDHLEPDHPLAMDTVTINYPVDLRLVAECVDTSVSNLQELNPSLLRMTTPKEGSFDLRLPAGTSEKYREAIASIPVEMRVWWRYQKVEDGDTLAGLAKKYRTTPKAILEANNLQDAELPRDVKLIIPMAPGKNAPEKATYSKKAVAYRVRTGDTVLSVADEWGVPADMIRKWNHLRGNELKRGRSLIIHRTVDDSGHMPGAQKIAKSKGTKGLRASSTRQHRLHTVQPGETLYAIANRYNTTVATLRRDNSRLNAKLKPGDVIVVNSAR